MQLKSSTLFGTKHLIRDLVLSQRTKMWFNVSGSSVQNTQPTSPCHPFLQRLSTVRSLYFKTVRTKIRTFNGIDYQRFLILECFSDKTCRIFAWQKITTKPFPLICKDTYTSNHIQLLSLRWTHRHTHIPKICGRLMRTPQKTTPLLFYHKLHTHIHISVQGRFNKVGLVPPP